jgi:hypothetical protein
MIGSTAQEAKINLRAETDLQAWLAKTYPGDTAKQQALVDAYKGYPTQNDAIVQISTDSGAGCVSHIAFKTQVRERQRSR